MTTYLHGSSSEIQADSASCSLQTLYLMTPNNYLLTTATSSTGYSDTPHHVLHPTQSHHHHQYIMNPGGSGGGGSLLFLNSPHSNYNINPHLPAVIGSEDLNRSFSSPPPSSSSSSSHHRLHYNNMWGGIGILSSTDHHRSSSIPTGTITTAAATGTHQGLSLSLSYHRQLQASVAVAAAGSINIMDIDTSASNGRDIVMGSKYLKAAQQLLDEVVKVVGKGINGYQLAEGELAGKVVSDQDQDQDHDQSTTDHDHIRKEGSGGGETTEKQQRGHQLFTSTAQRQELQMKKAKLVNMLDEVEQRYKQYHNQMQIVVSSFEEAAGTGSTKSYTSLALQTISKQFRCLKDAIASQIKAVAGSLGDQDHDGSTRVLKFVDQQLRQQRALHQIGTIIMPQHNHHMNNAWRPQRGLPESAVSVLRAWLFEHFLHPYPKDSDKHMLAKQTGLTRSQVSNWFINARVRLWKPMVEEMYLEEMKQHDQENNINNTIITDGELLPNKELLLAAAGESKSEISPQIIRVDHDHHQTNSNNSIDHHDVIINKYPSTFHLEQHQILRSPTPNDHHVYSSPKKAKPFLENNDNINGGNGFGTYNQLIMISTDDDQMGHHDHDHDQFDHHGAGFHDFLSSQMVQTSHYGGMMTSTSSNSAPHSSNIIMNINNNGTYETMISSSSTAMAINNNRKRFAAPLLPDFVA